MLRTALWRVISFVVFSFIAAGLLNPASVFAEDSAPVLKHALFLPSVVVDGEVVEPELVQFRSCSGKFQVLPVGDLTALSQECLAGTSYPDLTLPGQAVVWGAIKFQGWNIAIHTKGMGPFEGQFKVLMGEQAPYLFTVITGTSLSLSRAGEVFAMSNQPLVIDGWTVTQLEVEGFEFKRGGNTIWLILKNGEIWIEAQLLTHSNDTGPWSVMIQNGALIPEDFEEAVIVRYDLQ